MTTNESLLSRALDSAGGRAEFERKHQQYSDSLAYLDQAMEELVGQYNNEWVAVFKSTLVGHASEYGKLVKKIEREGLPIEEVVIKFLTKRKVMTLF